MVEPVPGARVVVHDARRLVAEGLASLLPDGREIAAARAVCSLGAIAESLATSMVDVLVLATSAPADGVLEIVRCVRAHGRPAAVLILTDDARPTFARRAMQERVAGILPLNSSTQYSLRRAVADVAAGKRCFATPAPDERTVLNPLKDREIDVLRLAVQGLSSRQIASTIHFSHGTVRNYLSAAIRKVGASNRIEAGRLASERGWV